MCRRYRARGRRGALVPAGRPPPAAVRACGLLGAAASSGHPARPQPSSRPIPSPRALPAGRLFFKRSHVQNRAGGRARRSGSSRARSREPRSVLLPGGAGRGAHRARRATRGSCGAERPGRAVGVPSRPAALVLLSVLKPAGRCVCLSVFVQRRPPTPLQTSSVAAAGVACPVGGKRLRHREREQLKAQDTAPRPSFYFNTSPWGASH